MNNPPIHPGIARMLSKRVEQGQEWNDDWIPQGTRAVIRTTMKTSDFEHVCREVYSNLSSQGQITADLQAIIFEADQALAAYLTDNTEEVFEEIPELDGILTILREASL